nr:hypothetical protein Iba_chr12eCG2000 [Ipomoea batatas]GMD71999.1 hypothetical protein Iba_chr12fCG4330 [Ipomoea batatas]
MSNLRVQLLDVPTKSKYQRTTSGNTRVQSGNDYRNGLIKELHTRATAATNP